MLPLLQGWEHVVAFVSGGDLESPSAAWLVANASDDCMRLLNLSRDWLGTYLPHCFSKIDRVTYGLLREEEVRVGVGRVLSVCMPTRVCVRVRLALAFMTLCPTVCCAQLARTAPPWWLF